MEAPEAPLPTMPETEVTPHIFPEELEEAAEAAGAGQASSQRVEPELPVPAELEAPAREAQAADPTHLIPVARAEMGNVLCITSQRPR